MIFRAGNTVANKTGRVFALRVYIPMGKMNNTLVKKNVCQALGRAVGIRNERPWIRDSQSTG